MIPHASSLRQLIPLILGSLLTCTVTQADTLPPGSTANVRYRASVPRGNGSDSFDLNDGLTYSEIVANGGRINVDAIAHIEQLSTPPGGWSLGLSSQLTVTIDFDSPPADILPSEADASASTRGSTFSPNPGAGDGPDIYQWLPPNPVFGGQASAGFSGHIRPDPTKPPPPGYIYTDFSTSSGFAFSSVSYSKVSPTRIILSISSGCIGRIWAGGADAPSDRVRSDSNGQIGVKIITPEPIGYTLGVNVFANSVPGGDQGFPLLPNTQDGNEFGLMEIPQRVTPSGGTSQPPWIDPPIAFGYRYEALDGTKFTRVAGFPSGIDADDTFRVHSGGSFLGSFQVGQEVDFSGFPGGGVTSFSVTGIDPGTDAHDGRGFPLQVDFDTATANIDVTALEVPELDLPPPSGGVFTFTWPSVVEGRYTVKSTTNFQGWTTEGDPQAGTGSVMTFSIPFRPGANLFRVEVD